MTETLRKKCAACGLICFAADEACRRCGADRLFSLPSCDDAPDKAASTGARKPSFWVYPLSFLLAIVVEFIALLPSLGSVGMRHAANAPVSQYEIDAARLFFITHLPSTLPPYIFNSIIAGNPITVLYLFVPFMQIVFWTCLFIYTARKLRF